MSVPSSISQLSTTASLNSPAGTDPIGNNLAPYLNAHAAFIAQVANGTGLTFTQALSMNSFQINNLAPGVAVTDAVNMSQLKAYLPIGAIMLYSGAVANIPTVWGADWALCNGANGTPNLTNQFVIGAGGAYAPGATGGTTTYALSVANMPSHTHGINDPGHTHGVDDPGHAHGVYDPTHSHTSGPGGMIMDVVSGGGYGVDIQGSNAANGTINPSATGIGIYAAGTGIGIYGSGTGVSIQYTGSGAAFTVIPPYYALCYVMKIASN
jgi:hypothetical protein